MAFIFLYRKLLGLCFNENDVFVSFMIFSSMSGIFWDPNAMSP